MVRPKTTPDEAPPTAGESDYGAALDFVAFASKAMPLTALLDGLPQRAARLLGSAVVSIYLLEGHGDGLVLRRARRARTAQPTRFNARADQLRPGTLARCARRG